MKHAYQSSVPDSGNASLVEPSNWNDSHILAWTSLSVDTLLSFSLHDSILATGGSGGITLTLPSPVGQSGRGFYIYRADSGSGLVTIAGTIDGVTDYFLVSQGEYVEIVSDGGSWLIINESGLLPGLFTPLSGLGSSADGTKIVSIPNFTFDPVTGDVTLGDNIYGAPVTKLGVYSTDGIIFTDNSTVGTAFYELGTGGFIFDATGNGGGGTGPIDLISAGGITLSDTNNSIPLFIYELGNAPIGIESNGSGGIYIDGRGTDVPSGGAGTSSVNLYGAAGLYLLDVSAVGVIIDSSQGGGTGPITLTSAGTIVLVANRTTIDTPSAGNLTALEVTSDGSESGEPITIQANMQATDDAASEFFGVVYNSNPQISGSNVGGDTLLGLRIGVDNLSTGGKMTEATAILVSNPGILTASSSALTTGLHIQDQNESGKPGDLNAAILLDNQTAGTGVYAIKTGLGPVSFGDTFQVTGPDSSFDVDVTTPGVITASTILNAVGGLQQNGNPVATNLTTTANADGAIPLGYSNIDATGGSSGITLTSAALVPDGLPPVTIMKVDSGAGPVNISGTINGDAGGYSLTVQWQYVTLYGNGSALFVKGNN